MDILNSNLRSMWKNKGNETSILVMCVCVYVCMCVSLSVVSYSLQFDSMDYSLPGSSVHAILQARILKWVAISSSRGPS